MGNEDKIAGLKPGDGVIFNLDDDTGVGTHWTAMVYPNSYFDSFGLKPRSEVLSHYPLKYYNNRQIQHNNATSCGFWAVWFIYNRPRTEEEYFRLLDTLPNQTHGSLENEKYLQEWFDKKLRGGTHYIQV